MSRGADGRAFTKTPHRGSPPRRCHSMELLAGQSVGLIHEVKPAGQIIAELVTEAREIISQRLAELIETKASAG